MDGAAGEFNVQFTGRNNVEQPQVILLSCVITVSN